MNIKFIGVIFGVLFASYLFSSDNNHEVEMKDGTIKRVCITQKDNGSAGIEPVDDTQKES